MTIRTVTENPVRSDVGPAGDPAVPPAAPPSRRWAVAGVGAGVAGLGMIISSTAVDAVSDPALKGDSAAQADRLADQLPQIVAFHTLAGISAVLLLVFAAGLYRRLRATAGDGVAPLVAFAGLGATAVVLVLGSGLDTEFLFGLSDEGALDPANAVFYAHWVATIPWVWMLAGLAGLGVFSVARAGGAPRWLGFAGAALGGITLLGGLSPLQYLAGFTGPVLVAVLALGFAAGDRRGHGRA
ncbi:hypothetical protein I6A84_15840 [Frankia sp. CNm7]|uniref:DUF4386 family protein n=1 Tax=Frankia nepalensis TaxID=1836974 RepID=A0A937RLR4_9ACTN|nr:hypothetical protein [Frankia nepalensis]MBL7499521.1 hypothetical protein [Frankia nepalensis]MBL7511721.1 hypothetical protein [Frankia nepalensis]MBL7519531.1 hypothetical protein [Frankia nepalensis]MBL7628226.1 hypothetical protein [Frankia nepalensis]